MPARKERFPLQKVTVKLFEGDFRELGDLYPKSGANRIIREMVHRHIAVVKERAQQAVAALPVEEIDVQLDDEVISKEEL